MKRNKGTGDYIKKFKVSIDLDEYKMDVTERAKRDVNISEICRARETENNNMKIILHNEK